MNLFARRLWYAEGLAFECQQCGRCCAGPEEGYVWVNEQDIVAIANHLKLSVAEVYGRHIRKVDSRFTLAEQPGSRDCIYLQADEAGRRRCTVYPVRPLQCRTWPFWPSNLADPQSWAEAGRRCGGINHGQPIPLDRIEKRRLVTRE